MTILSPPPLPRFRLYTTPAGYVRTLLRTAVGERGEGALREVEAEVMAFTGAKNALCMPQARVGIYFAVRELIEPGQKVVLSPYTISDVINMVICAGGVPTFADIELGTCNIDPAEIERLIDDDTGAVMVTHFYGLACNMERIVEICRRKDVPLIEDAAQAFGARLGGQALGTFGDAGIYSYGMYKNVNSFYGGMLVTPHTELREKIAQQMTVLPVQRRARLLAKVFSTAATDVVTWPPVFRSSTYWLFRYAYLHNVGLLNGLVALDEKPEIKRSVPESYLFRMSPAQARQVMAQIAGVDTASEKRIGAARAYCEGLGDIEELILPPLREDGSHIYNWFPMQYDDREALVRHVLRRGRDIAISHHKNCAQMGCFQEFARDCPNAARVASSLIYLPSYPRYSRTEIERTISAVRSYFGVTRDSRVPAPLPS